MHLGVKEVQQGAFCAYPAGSAAALADPIDSFSLQESEVF